MRKQYRYVLLILASALAGATSPPLAVDITPIQQFFLIKELKPDVERLGIIWDGSTVDVDATMKQLQRAGAASHIKVFLAEVSSLKDVAPQFRTLSRQRKVQALWVYNGKGVMDNKFARSYLIKNATSSEILIFAPDDSWVSEGASVFVQKADGGIKLVVNRASAEALALTIPEKYADRTQYLAAN